MPRRAHGRRPKPPTRTRPAPRAPVRGVLIFIGIAYAAIAAAYALSIPFGQAPDESAHLPYITHLASHWRLPVFGAGGGSYEYHQAPLYYAAALPAYLLGAALAPTRAYVAVRLFGIVFGLGVIYLTYLLTRDLCPGQPWLAVGSAGLVAFLPMHVALSASVTNDIAANVPVAAGLWQLVIATRDGWPWRRVLIIGALCGLAVLSKSLGLILLPVAWVALALRAREDGVRPIAVRALVVTAVALAVCGWWLARNWALYGDPLALRAFMEAFEGAPTRHSAPWASLSAFNYLLVVAGWTFASFWGVFGNMTVFLPTWGCYMPLAVFTSAALAGAARAVRDYERLEPWRRRAGWVLAVAAVLVIASFVRFNMSFFQAQGRYLFPALPVFALVLVAGWGRLFPPRWRAVAYTVVWVAMLALAAVALPWWILPQI